MLGTAVSERNYVRAILAGVVATLAMGIYAYLIAPAAGLPTLDFGSVIGTLFVPSGSAAVALGLALALLVGIIWALLYERVIRAIWPGPEWLTGTVWGLIAWIIAGLALGVLAPAAGFFGLGSGGWALPVSIFLAFLLYGLALGLTYEFRGGALGHPGEWSRDGVAPAR